ncbi:hypothetical protein [Kytococcus sedentarius]|uniref:hypothetical protein n=1 Tax=Kytococcus sedentarius TaxID=1276 RepID=UPI0035BBB9C9
MSRILLFMLLAPVVVFAIKALLAFAIRRPADRATREESREFVRQGQLDDVSIPDPDEATFEAFHQYRIRRGNVPLPDGRPFGYRNWLELYRVVPLTVDGRQAAHDTPPYAGLPQAEDDPLPRPARDNGGWGGSGLR